MWRRLGQNGGSLFCRSWALLTPAENQTKWRANMKSKPPQLEQQKPFMTPRPNGGTSGNLPVKGNGKQGEELWEEHLGARAWTGGRKFEKGCHRWDTICSPKD